MRIFLRFEGRRVACRRCGRVKPERPDWLAENPHFTRRFALSVGRLCREMTIKRVAALLHLPWDQVKDLDKQSMQALLAKAPAVRPRALGIDEVSLRKRPTYRVLVSDLDAERPIWFGGAGRKAEDVAQGMGDPLLTKWNTFPVRLRAFDILRVETPTCRATKAVRSATIRPRAVPHTIPACNIQGASRCACRGMLPVWPPIGWGGAGTFSQSTPSITSLISADTP